MLFLSASLHFAGTVVAIIDPTGVVVIQHLARGRRASFSVAHRKAAVKVCVRLRCVM